MTWDYDEDDPVRYACEVFEAYESEILEAIARGDIPNGFCQGSIFLWARKGIQRRVRNAAVKGHTYADSVSQEGGGS